LSNSFDLSILKYNFGISDDFRVYFDRIWKFDRTTANLDTNSSSTANILKIQTSDSNVTKLDGSISIAFVGNNLVRKVGLYMLENYILRCLENIEIEFGANSTIRMLTFNNGNIDHFPGIYYNSESTKLQFTNNGSTLDRFEW
jgi:hypothetical protein